MNQQDQSNIYLWFDTEFSSLTLERAHLLQVAIVPTDAQLARIAGPECDFNCCVQLPDGVTCDPWVQENLKGLLARCSSDAALPVADVNTKLEAWLEASFGPCQEDIRKRPVLAGNSIHSDWFLSRKFLPALIARVHYRILEVSSWKVFWNNTVGASPFDKDNLAEVKQYFPGEFSSDEMAHDAHFDVLASIAEMNFYRQHLEVHPPSPPAQSA